MNKPTSTFRPLNDSEWLSKEIMETSMRIWNLVHHCMFAGNHDVVFKWVRFNEMNPTINDRKLKAGYNMCAIGLHERFWEEIDESKLTYKEGSFPLE